MSLILIFPVAHRKGTFNFVKYPIANCLSYLRLSDSHKAFTSKITNLFVPRNIQEALSNLNWKLAVMEEMNALKQHCTWDIVELKKKRKQLNASGCSR